MEPEIPMPAFPPQRESLLSRLKSLLLKSRLLLSFALLFFVFSVVVLGFTTKNLINKFEAGNQTGLRELNKQGNTDTDEFEKLVLPQKEPPFFSVSASTVSRFGVLPQESFTLKAKSKTSQEFILQNLQTSSPVKMSSRGDNEFLITPAKPLDKDQVFQIRLAVGDKEIEGHKFDRNYSWSYQTQGKFRVIGSLPGDKKKDVPLNSGIEITFSQDDYKDPKGYISINPPFDFRLERHAETLAIVPLKPLLPKTVYSVMLKGGLDLESRHDPIEEDFIFVFQTAEEKKIVQPLSLNLDKNFVQIAVQEPLTTKVFTKNWKNETVKAKIFQFPDSLTFIKSREKIDQTLGDWWNYFPEKERVPTDNLSLVSQVDLKIEKKGETEYLSLEYLQLPSALPVGYYFIQFLYGQDNLEQLWLQVTDLAGYVAVGEKQTTVWVNTLDDGQPAKQAKIQILGSDSQFTANDQGATVFDTPKGILDKKRHYLEITSQSDKKLILPIVINDKSKPVKDDFWSYLYHERSLYLPNDTVYFWGVIKNRDSGKPPTQASVSVRSGYSYDNNSLNLIKDVTVSPRSDGSFFGNIQFSDLPPAWYHLSLRVDGVEIESTGFQVMEYVKPEIKIEVKTDKKAIFANETIEFTAQVKFYDETPASTIPLKIHEETTGKVTEIKTDKQGKLTYALQTKSSDSYPGSYQCITIAPALVKEAKIEGQGCVYVVNYKLLMATEGKQEENQAILKTTVNNVDLDKYNKDSSKDFKGALASGQKVTFETTKIWWEQVEKGTYYDFIEKTTHPKFDYIKHEEKVETKDINTDNQGEITYGFKMEKQKSYTVLVYTFDSNQHKIQQYQYFYYYKNAQNYSPNNQPKPELNILKKENSYSLNEDVKLIIRLGEKDYPDNDKNRFLFIIAQRGGQEAFVEEKPDFHFSYQEKYIPNVYVGAVVFTGRYYQVVFNPCLWSWQCSSYYYYYNNYSFPGINIIYNNKDRNLNLTIEYDKNIYKPGEDAAITVTVEDQDKKKMENANVNLILVDQALEAIGGVIAPNILPSIYRNVNLGIYYSYHSHEPVFPNESQAERGGGGGGGRDIFKDTGFFGEKQTNSQGQAVFTFKLPDNITSWRVYSQAITEGLYVGQNDGSLIASQDFFVVPNFPREILQRDKPLLIGSSFGKTLNIDAKISYKATFYDNEKEITKIEKEGTAFKTIDFPFPNIASGNYKLSLEGKTGSDSDKITLPFNVIEYRFFIKQELSKKLKAGGILTPLKDIAVLNQKPITLVVSDEGKGKYYWQLVHFCYRNSNRIEKNLAKNVAGRILKESFDNSACPLNEEDLVKFQETPDGGLSQVWWGGSNLESTVWSIYVNSEPFDKDKLIKYLSNKIDQKDTGTIEKIQAAWGLANLDKPVINNLNYLANKAVSFEEKIISALAFASSGETEKARDIYFNILADYAYTHKPYIRIQSQTSGKQTQDKLLKDTGMTLLLGYLVEPEYNSGLYSYIRDYKADAQDIVLDLGEMAFIKEQLNKSPNEYTQMKYKSQEREEVKEMKKGGSWIIDINPQEKNNYSLQILSGKVEAITQFFVGVDGLKSAKPDPRLSVKRSYKNAKGESTEFIPGDIIEVKLDFDFDEKESPKYGYTLTDILPSGLAYLNNPEDYGLKTRDWVYEQDKNIIKFHAYNTPWWLASHGKSFTYYARVAGAGIYFSEPSLFQSELDPSVFTYTPVQEITIEKAGD